MSVDKISSSRLVKISKYLSKHLRHAPEQLGLQLAPGGWVQVDELLMACAGLASPQGNRAQFPISRAELEAVVSRNDKQRFAFDTTRERIRANQGHSIAVDLQLEPVAPPAVLYHGTGHRAVDSILRQGLRKMSRHHVHLSKDMETARKVGSRHGRPVIFAVDTAAMSASGFTFYCSNNGVWLVEQVPSDYLTKLETNN